MNKLSKTLLAVSIIGAILFFRLLPAPHNFSPLGAVALFGAFAISNRYLAFGLPLAALFATDLFLGFHETMPFVYGSFLLIAVIGRSLRAGKSRLGLRAFGGSLLGSFTFFTLSNFGVWLMSGLYAFSLSGFVQCYLMAIPFFHQTLLGDLFFNGLAFGAWALAHQFGFVRSSSARI